MITDLWFAGRDLLTVLTHRDPVSEVERQAVQRFHAALDRAARRDPGDPARDVRIRAETWSTVRVLVGSMAFAASDPLVKAALDGFQSELLTRMTVAEAATNPAEDAAQPSVVSAEGSGHPQPATDDSDGPPARLDNPPAAGAQKDWRWGFLPCGCHNDGYGRHVR
jgi:hypothetical protein